VGVQNKHFTHHDANPSAHRAGNDIKSLSRYIGAQQLGFVKLLKKYKKWTNSTGLEQRFKDQVISKPNSLWKADLTHLLEIWTDVLTVVRASTLDAQHRTSRPASPVPRRNPVSFSQRQRSDLVASSVSQVVASNSHVKFDTVFAVTPRGDRGSRAIYWVHSDYVLQLQVLLFQHFRPLLPKTRSIRSQSTASSIASSRKSSLGQLDSISPHDREAYAGFCVIDDLERFVRSHNSAPVADTEDPLEMRKRGMGSSRWTYQSEANIFLDPAPEDRESRAGDAMMVRVKRKRLQSFFNLDQPFASRRNSSNDHESSPSSPSLNTNTEKLDNTRSWLMKHRNVKPLAGACSRRARYVGTQNDAASGHWAVLDQDITMAQSLHNEIVEADWPSNMQRHAERFPHALLEVRQEGECPVDIIGILDASHLVSLVCQYTLKTLLTSARLSVSEDSRSRRTLYGLVASQGR